MTRSTRASSSGPLSAQSRRDSRRIYAGTTRAGDAHVTTTHVQPSPLATAELEAQRRDALAERLFGAGIAAGELATIFLGGKLGLYAALRQAGPSTAAELARRASTHERSTREWLEQQAVAGILDVDNAKCAPD